MRDLAIKTLSGNERLNIENVNASIQTCVPYACELVGVAINLTQPTTIAHSFDVIVDEPGTATNLGLSTDSGIDIVLPSGFTQGVVSPQARVFIGQAGRISLESHGDTATASTDAVFTYLLRPLSPRPANEIWLYGHNMGGIQVASGSSRTIAPLACKVVAYVGSFWTPVNALVTLRVQINSAFGAGDSYLAVPNGSTHVHAPPVPNVSIPAGEDISSLSDGAGTTGYVNSVCWVVQPDGPGHPAGWVFLPFPGVIDIGAAQHFTDVVTPVSGRVRNLMLHAKVPIDVETNFALRVNGVAPAGAPNYRLPVNPLDEVGSSLPLDNVHDVYVVAGDRIDVLSDGAMAPSYPSAGGVWIEPMEGIR